MKNILIVVDMQKDFIDGSLGSAEAVKIVPAAVKKIKAHDGAIFVTLDTHFGDYLDTPEGKKLPVKHCIKGTDGHRLNDEIAAALDGKEYTAVEKLTFGSVGLPELIRRACAGESAKIELIGLCTDICVVSNALLLKAAFPEFDIAVDASCCAGVTPDLHRSALSVMCSCQIDIVDE